MPCLRTWRREWRVRKNCASLFTDLTNRRAIADKSLMRRVLSVRTAAQNEASSNVYWLTGPESPEEARAMTKGDLAPPLLPMRDGPLFLERFASCAKAVGSNFIRT